MTVAHSKVSTQLPKSLIGRLHYHAETTPDHDAFVSRKSNLSYLQLTQLVETQAKKLQEDGISQDAVVGIYCANDIEHLILTLATISIGATSFTVPSHDENQVQNAIAQNCGATHFVDDDNVIDLEKQNYSSITSLFDSQTATLLFSTSGTSGTPKLVVLHDVDLVSQAHRHISSSHERFTCLASIEHNFVKRHRLYCLAMGATNIFIENGYTSLVDECLSHNVNVMHVSAFQAQELLGIANISKLSHVRLKLGGSHVNKSLRENLRKKITQNLQAGYGTTETGAIAFTNPADSDDHDSVGQALPGIEVRTVAPDRSTLASGKHGELAIRCKGMFREYLGNPELTTSRLVDGWFYTGDIGYLDDQQRIHLSGRADDMFTFNSINIYPQDIESQILQYPGIKDAAVLPKASTMHGKIPVALLVFSKDVKPDLPVLNKFMKKQLGIRCPRQFILVDEIPRNTTGKISRYEALRLCNESDDVRENIIQILGEHATNNLKHATIAAFIKGDTDIKLRKLKLDSLARMDLLVALEVHYETIIAPQELANFRYLGNLVARVLSTQSENDAKLVPQTTVTHTSYSKSEPHIVKLFKRIFRYCQTVAQLNKALTTLENRLTPLEAECLYQSYHSQQLISSDSADKFHLALEHWLQSMSTTMRHSGKKVPESFIGHRIAPTVRYYSKNEPSADKTLLICFTAAGAHNMGMANNVFLQHMNANQYDMLIITEPLNEKYLQGVPHLGTNIYAVIAWLVNLQLVKNYQRIRTLGYSAGSYPALLAGHHLGAELAVSIGGRFHTKSHPLKSLQRLFTTWKTVRKRQCSNTLMVYAINEPRDRVYAKIIAAFTSGKLLEVNIVDENIHHLFLSQLLERGELANFLAQTIFAEMDDQCVSNHNMTLNINFPMNKSSSYH